MYIERSIPCAVNSKQLAVIFRDLGRVLYYESPKRQVAVASRKGLVCQGWNALPEWVRSAEVRKNDGEVILSIDLEQGVRPGEPNALLTTLAGQLAGLVSHPVKPFPKHVFCIGWQRTGTTSLTEALRMLGLFSWHFAPWVIGLTHGTDEIALPSIDFTGITDYAAMSDLPVCALFKELDEAFPGSFFILTTRHTDAWIESASNLAQEIVRYCGNLDSVMRWAYGIGTVDQKIFGDRFTRHEKEVCEYFGDRKDLLVIDVTRGNPWPALCNFLRVPGPGVPFPHLNRRPVNTASASH